MKINFGCGGNHLDGWINHDIEVDITQRLPYADNVADAIFAEHVVEHTNSHESHRFLSECHRILKPSHCIRITVPSIVKAWEHCEQDYIDFVHNSFGAPRTKEGAVAALIYLHGHQMVWTTDLLKVYMLTAGFSKAFESELYASQNEVFIGVEGHQKVIGDKFNNIESIVVEGVK